jgi:hypothetical protein
MVLSADPSMLQRYPQMVEWLRLVGEAWFV